MTTVKLAKIALRKEIKKRISLLNKSEKQRISNIVADKVLKSKYFNDSKRVSIFISMDDEIQTQGIIERIFQLEKLCFIPRYSFDKIHMDMVRLDSSSEIDTLPVTKWKIKQPDVSDKRENALLTGGLDLIFVPGLAFTEDGKRLGRGKGFYDTFLKECKEKHGYHPTTIGLAFDEQICDDIPTDDHDIKLDLVVFPNERRAS